ncbi:MAG: SDR family NAD(P)-dependent oxidoreductase [Verrucomicrobiae bacterium]|nr:SDR family NAD(P)-dependent oxidoreductase [Verrucomicrobiae bacterium]
MSRIAERYQRALITGAGSGLGKAFATRLIREGVEVWGTSRKPENLEPSDRFRPIQLDLVSEPDLGEWFERWERESGGFDLVINNAGLGVLAPVEKLRNTDIITQIQVMLSGPILLATHSFSVLRAGKKGCLVNVSSMAGVLPIPFLSVYNATKAGLSAFSQSIMMEAPKDPPWVIDFLPGDYDTAVNRNMKKLHMDSKDCNRVWHRLEELMSEAPQTEKAADDLIRALKKFRHCTCTSGSFVQTSIASWLRRLSPATLQRKILRRYYRLP